MKTLKLTIAAAAVALFAACSPANTEPDGQGPTLPPTSAATSSESEKKDPKRNDRGNLVKELGEEAGFSPTGGPDSSGVVKFAIDKIEVDPACDAYGQAPSDGHTLLLHIRVATGDNRVYAEQTPGILNPFNFSEIGKDGVTRPAQLGMCTDPSKQLPTTFGPNQRYSGTIELVVPEASGTLMLSMPFDNASGWEWHY